MKHSSFCHPEALCARKKPGTHHKCSNTEQVTAMKKGSWRDYKDSWCLCVKACEMIETWTRRAVSGLYLHSGQVAQRTKESWVLGVARGTKAVVWG